MTTPLDISRYLKQKLIFFTDLFTTNNEITNISRTGNIVTVTTNLPHNISAMGNDDSQYIGGIWSKWNITDHTIKNEGNAFYISIETSGKDALTSIGLESLNVFIDGINIKDSTTHNIISNVSGMYNISFSGDNILCYNDLLLTTDIGIRIRTGLYYLDSTGSSIRILFPRKYEAQPFNRWLKKAEMTIIDATHFTYQCNQFEGTPYIDTTNAISTASLRYSPRIYDTGIQLEKFPSTSIASTSVENTANEQVNANSIYCLYAYSSGKKEDNKTPNLSDNIITDFAIIIFLKSSLTSDQNKYLSFNVEIKEVLSNLRPRILSLLSYKTFENNSYYPLDNRQNGLVYEFDKQVTQSSNAPIYAHLIGFKEITKNYGGDKDTYESDYYANSITLYNNSLDNKNISSMDIDI